MLQEGVYANYKTDSPHNKCEVGIISPLGRFDPEVRQKSIADRFVTTLPFDCSISNTRCCNLSHGRVIARYYS